MSQPQGQPVGRTLNTSYFAAEPRILVAWPDEDTLDTAETAAANSDFQIRYFHSIDSRGVVVIYFDRMQGQDRGARKAYSARTNDTWALGIVLIGGSLLSRALGSFFMGLSRPAVPIRLFPSYEAASPWITQLLEGQT